MGWAVGVCTDNKKNWAWAGVAIATPCLVQVCPLILEHVLLGECRRE